MYRKVIRARYSVTLTGQAYLDGRPLYLPEAIGTREGTYSYFTGQKVLEDCLDRWNNMATPHHYELLESELVSVQALSGIEWVHTSDHGGARVAALNA